MGGVFRVGKVRSRREKRDVAILRREVESKREERRELM